MSAIRFPPANLSMTRLAGVSLVFPVPNTEKLRNKHTLGDTYARSDVRKSITCTANVAQAGKYFLPYSAEETSRNRHLQMSDFTTRQKYL